jgi:hypothetical protein
MGNLEENLASLQAAPSVADFVRTMASARSVASDRRANYLSLRPVPVGAIAIYCHAGHVSIAVDPPKAVDLRSQKAFKKQILKTPSTTYVIVSEALVATEFARVVDLAIESVDWRAQGPQLTLGGGHQSKRQTEPDLCPNCWVQITPAGACWCE